MKKQTVVEWLFQRFEDGDMYNVEDAQFIKRQAKQMHKEEIIESYLVGQEVTALYATTGKSSQTSIQYYNETYKGGQQ